MYDYCIEGTDWKPMSKLMMPEFMARHYLKVIDVRVERLQDISDEDGKETWDSNPYVFVYDFKYLTKEQVSAEKETQKKV